MIDDLLPQYDFTEHHSRRLPVTPEQAWAALESVRLSDLPLARPLMALRHAGGGRTDAPLLTDGPVTLLHVEPGCAVAGAIGRPWRPGAERRPVRTLAEFAAFDEPGWTTYLTEFAVRPVAGGCVLSTTTRGRSTDAAARRRFRLYWLLIRPFSGLVRRDVLRAVERLAVAGAVPDVVSR